MMLAEPFVRLSRKEQALSAAGLAALGLALAVTFVFRPYADYLRKLDAQVQSKRIRLAKCQRLAPMKEEARQAFSKLAFARPGSNNEQAMSGFLTELEAQARKSGWRIQSIKPAPVARKDYYGELTVELQGGGAPGPLVEFLYGLQRADFSPAVRSLTVARGADSGLSARLTVSKVVVFAQPGGPH